MIIPKNMNERAKERRIMKEMSDYFTQNKFDANNEEMVKKYEDWMYKLFSINMEAMGYTPELVDDDDTMEWAYKVDSNSAMLCFNKGKDGSLEGYQTGGVRHYNEEDHTTYYKQRGIVLNGDYEGIKSTKDIYDKIETLYHEMNHMYQAKMRMEGYCSMDNLLNACAATIINVNFKKKNGEFESGEEMFYKGGQYRLFPLEADSFSNFELFEFLQPFREFGGVDITKGNVDYCLNKLIINSPDTIRGTYGMLNTLEKADITEKNYKEEPMLSKMYKEIYKTGRDGKAYTVYRLKTAEELMKGFYQDIWKIENNETDKSKKREELKDCKGMYFELLYRSLHRDNLESEQIKRIANMYDKNRDLFKDMAEYYKKKEHKAKVYIDKLENMEGVDEYCKKYFRRFGEENTRKEFFERTLNKYNEILSEIGGFEDITKGKVVANNMQQHKQIPKAAMPRDVVQPNYMRSADKSAISNEQVVMNMYTQENLDNSANGQLNNSQLSQKDFIKTFMSSYMRLESNSQYDNRATNEEGDMQAVVDIINKSKAGTLTKDDLLAYGITAQPMYDKNGQPIGTKGDYSEQSIDKMVRLVNAAKNLSLPGRNYIDEFININGINDIFEDMKNSKNVNSLIDRADIAKAQNDHGRGADRGLTPAEKEYIEAKKALEDLRNLGSGYSDERLYDMIRNDRSIGQGQMSMYNSKEELSLAKMLFRQDGKVPEDITEKMGEYSLNVDEKENEAPIKVYDVKKATLSLRLSEIKAKIKEIKDKVVNKIKGMGAKENDDKNR